MENKVTECKLNCLQPFVKNATGLSSPNSPKCETPEFSKMVSEVQPNPWNDDDDNNCDRGDIYFSHIYSEVNLDHK